MTGSRCVIVKTKWNYQESPSWDPNYTNDTLTCTLSTVMMVSGFLACRESWEAALEIYRPLVAEEGLNEIETPRSQDGN
jgi:hypothetical protein